MPLAFLQCAMCRANVSQSAILGIALNKAILLLIFPALLIFALIAWHAFRSNRRTGCPAPDANPDRSAV